ncbi:MAG: sugar-binding protein, partial [Terrimicrobiaceae bacterium]
QKALLTKTLAAEKVLNSISMDIPKETDGYFQRGVKIPARISIPASAGLNGKFTAHFLLRDIRNMVVVEETRELAASPDKEAAAVIELAPALCGIYFLDMWLADSSGKTVKKLPEEYGIAITVPLPPPDKIPLSSPLCAHYISGNFYENRFLGFGVDRWIKGSEAYKKFGEVDPKLFEKEMEFERKSGRKVMFCLHVGMPAWAERAPGKKFVLKDMNLFADYCKQMVRLYKDMVMAWEIENEPNGGNMMTPEEYAAMLKVAYKAIKEEDPNAIVVGLCGIDYLNWNEAVFKAGGAKDFDILSLHNYKGSPIPAQREKGIEKAIEQLEKYRGERVPVWNTESGYHTVVRVDGRPMAEDVFMRRFGTKITQAPGQPPVMAADMPTLLEHDAACWQVQSILLDLAAGAQKYFMLNGASHYIPDANACVGQPTEVGPAVAALASVLIPSQSVEKLPLSSSSDAGAIITQEGGRRIAALFSDETPTLSFRVDRSGKFEGMDLLGNPLTWPVSTGNILNIKLGSAPVYVYDVPKDFAQLQFLKVKAPSSLPDSGIMEGELTLHNPLDKALIATLKAMAPKGATIEVVDKIELKAGESKAIAFRLDGQKLGRRTYEIAFELFDGSSQLAKLSHSFASEGGIHKIPEVAAKAALADDTWWKNVEPVVCNEEDHVVQGKPIIGFPWAPHWSGPKDLSYTSRMAWQEDGSIFLRIEVTDDVPMPAPKEKREMCFQYDCIEIFLDERGLGQRNDIVEKGVEQVLVIPNTAKTTAPCDFWYARKNPTTHAEFVGGATATGYWIEGKLTPEPGTAFRVKAGTQFAFEVMVDDRDSEEVPRKVIMALHGDAANGTMPSKWGRYQLKP